MKKFFKKFISGSWQLFRCANLFSQALGVVSERARPSGLDPLYVRSAIELCAFRALV
jgi:hypothetical protein